MAISRSTRHGGTKKARIEQHIDELKSRVLAVHPEARFEVAPVPESRWPGLWVYADIESVWDIFDIVTEAQDKFFEREWMSVHVIPMQLDGADA